MGTKNKPGNYDCYANAHPDEPMFVLLARDPFAAALVRAWAEHREGHSSHSHPTDAKLDEARACADAMVGWFAANRPGEQQSPHTITVTFAKPRS